MATDLEKLVVQMSADIKGFEREMRKAVGVSNQNARAIENRYRAMNKNLDGIGRNAARSLIAPLAGVSAALSVREVARYADAWTGATNALAVAGVTGERQKQVLDALYLSAQANGAPLTALADLYGKAAQASDNLGASQSELIEFSDGIATALRVAGVSATQASGSLTQLGQLLGSARVQAEEFNSINEGARPILIAVANGLDKAGGSVSKLKQLVNDGEVSGREFFEAFLRGLPKVQAMAANATTTIDQGLTKVNNAFTKFIGETDSSLGASQRLVLGLSALADNFDQVADTTLKVAGVIAGALIGRSLGLMLVKLGLATTAVVKFVAALRAASSVTGLATAIGGLSVAAAPIGALLGVTAVGAMMLYSQSADGASSASATLTALMEKLGLSSDEAAGRVEASADRIARARDKMTPTDELAAKEGMDSASKAVESLEADIIALVSRFEGLAMEKGISDELLDKLIEVREEFQDGSIDAEQLRQEIAKLALLNPSFSSLVSALTPLSAELNSLIGKVQTLGTLILSVGSGGVSPEVADSRAEYVQSRTQGEKISKDNDAFIAEQRRRNSLSKDAAAIEDEVNRLLKERPELLRSQADMLARENIAATAARRGGSKSGGNAKTLERFDDSILKEIEGMKAETAALNALTGAQIGYGTAVERARKEAEILQDLQNKGIKVTPELRKQVSQLADEWQKAAQSNEDATERLERMEAIGQSVASALSSAFESAFDDPKQALEDLGKQLAMLAIKMQLANLLPGVFGASGVMPLNFASGGHVRGPGSGTSDSIPARLSNGEFVVNAAATSRNRKLLEAINSGRSLSLAAGGYVGPASIPTVARVGGGGGSSFQIIDQRAAGAPDIEMQRQRGPNGREMIKAVVRDEMTRGAFNGPMKGRYGLNSKKVTR